MLESILMKEAKGASAQLLYEWQVARWPSLVLKQYVDGRSIAPWWNTMCHFKKPVGASSRFLASTIWPNHILRVGRMVQTLNLYRRNNPLIGCQSTPSLTAIASSIKHFSTSKWQCCHKQTMLKQMRLMVFHVHTRHWIVWLHVANAHPTPPTRNDPNNH